ncbi:MAG TPA: ATP-binding protein [Polyangiaceae bacterium]|nr:ATP-binding protein [Polyangiaceae bacterium]
MMSSSVHSLIDPLGSPVSLSQLLDAQGLEEILSSFYALFRIPVRIIDDDGTTVGRSRKPSAFNEYLGELPATRQRLGQEHQHLRSHDPGDAEAFSHTAFTGGSYHVAMVGHEGRRIGRFILGPFIKPEVRDLPAALLEAEARLDSSRARELLLALPRVREDTVKAIARHLTVTLDVLIFAGHRALLSEYMHLSTVQENQRQLSARDEGLLAAEQRLAQTGRLQADFLVTALGELRTPLESIMGQSDALTSDDGQLPGQRDLVLAIRKRASELLALSGRLMDFSRADGGSLSLRREPIDLLALIERVANRLAAQAPERARALRVTCEGDLPPVLGDATCLEQVLMLIGENALRYAGDGEIAIDARRATDGDSDGMVLLGGAPEQIEIRVRDSGTGIPDAEKERVFEPFYRSPRPPDSTGPRPPPGSGLGLAIVKRSILAHGGSVRIEDNAPRGACLVVVLPAAPTL